MIMMIMMIMMMQKLTNYNLLMMMARFKMVGQPMSLVVIKQPNVLIRKFLEVTEKLEVVNTSKELSHYHHIKELLLNSQHISLIHGIMNTTEYMLITN